MGRKVKTGLSYFSKDVDYYDDFKIMDLMNEYLSGLVFITYKEPKRDMKQKLRDFTVRLKMYQRPLQSVLQRQT